MRIDENIESRKLVGQHFAKCEDCFRIVGIALRDVNVAQFGFASGRRQVRWLLFRLIVCSRRAIAHANACGPIAVKGRC